MKKLAFFVEGQTEMLLLERLLLEIADLQHCTINLRVASGGGRRHSRRFQTLHGHGATGSLTHYILITNCATDNRVASDVRDQYQSLVRAGYNDIIAIRDVYPDFSISEVPRLKRNLGYRIPTTPISPKFILGVMEVEAWFIAENNHFEALHSDLIPARVIPILGIDPATTDPRILHAPAQSLHDVYSNVGLAYSKNRQTVNRTLDAISLAHFYMDVSKRVPEVGQLMSLIDSFLEPLSV